METLNLTQIDNHSQIKDLRSVLFPEKDSPVYFGFSVDEKIIGGCQITLSYDFLVLDKIFIPEELRSQGYGVRLFMEVESLARKNNCRKILLSTLKSMGALDYWLKNGFELTGKVMDCPEGDELYYLAKDLSQNK